MDNNTDGRSCQRATRYNDQFGWWEFRCDNAECYAGHDNDGFEPVAGGEEEALARYFRHAAGLHVRRTILPGEGTRTGGEVAA